MLMLWMRYHYSEEHKEKEMDREIGVDVYSGSGISTLNKGTVRNEK